MAGFKTCVKCKGKDNAVSLQSLIDKPNELLEYINGCLKPKTKEKKQFGEVFAPMKLVNEMLDKLDECYMKEHNKSIFEIRDFKWIDPANGIGNFLIAVYMRLIQYHDKKHVLENMLYSSELYKQNNLIYRQIMNFENEYTLNTHEGNTLELDINKEWNIDGFDIIVGNPPFQDMSGNKGNKLWTKFVDYTMSYALNDNGFLVFVHPSLWRQINHPLQAKLTHKQMLYLELHNEKDGFKIFKANTRYDWYVLHNSTCIHKTHIKDELGITEYVKLDTLKFIPNNNFMLIQALTSSTTKVNVLHSESSYEPRKEWMRNSPSDEHIYKCIYSINRNNTPSFKYSCRNDKGHFGIPKVIWGGGATGFIFDVDGQYGMTQWASAIVDSKQALPLIYNAFQSDMFKKIIKAISVSKQEINYKILCEFNHDFYTLIQTE